MSICGELGGQPLEAMTLMGLGYRGFSLSSASVGPVKRMIRSVNMNRLDLAVSEALDAPEDDLRQQLMGIADGQGVKL